MTFAPLRGIRIVDFTATMAGPYGGMILAQLGADVIKVEPPRGDDSRHFASAVDDVSVVHRYVNAGKRGVVLDLKTEDGLAAALALCASADVVVQSMRPGVADRIGIGADAVRERNPGVLYYDVNAFGKGDVGRDLPGYDPLVQAFSGIMEMTGHDDSPPTRCAPSVVDLTTGMWTAMGIMAALLARERGQNPPHTLETALLDAAFSLVGYQATSALVSGERPPRAGSGNPIAAPYECYEASDGHVLVAAANQKLWVLVTEALEAPQLLDDERFATVADRSDNRAALQVEMSGIMRRRPIVAWLERFAAHGVPAGRVQGLEEAVAGDVAAERHTFQDSDGAPLVRLPWLVDGEPIPFRSRAPGLGEHTDEVLAELDPD